MEHLEVDKFITCVQTSSGLICRVSKRIMDKFGRSQTSSIVLRDNQDSFLLHQQLPHLCQRVHWKSKYVNYERDSLKKTARNTATIERVLSKIWRANKFPAVRGTFFFTRSFLKYLHISEAARSAKKWTCGSWAPSPSNVDKKYVQAVDNWKHRLGHKSLPKYNETGSSLIAKLVKKSRRKWLRIISILRNHFPPSVS